MAHAIELDGIVRTFEQGSRTIEVLRGASTYIDAGECVALVGPSGAGKSSLLHVAGLLERPNNGRVVIDGEDCSKMDDSSRTRLRRSAIGFVYQFHHLLPEFSALENVLIPQLILGRSRREGTERAKSMLASLGLEGRMGHRPAELSGGEQQRVAIARALANGPHVLLADEPTGNLDPETAERVFAALVELIRRERVAALIATHNLELAARMDRTLRLAEGRLVELTSGEVGAAHRR
ncbi:MAG: ATP-binding cassette domain-containing protein [Rhizobiales bacterium]|nr:ATP-binding cassette domain-containing protein [Hyphomicrobiales bacterium]